MTVVRRAEVIGFMLRPPELVDARSQLPAGRLDSAAYRAVEDARSGGFEPLANLPDEKVAVLGLVSTKWTRLEDRDELRARIEDSARFHPKEQLAIAPQRGFASAGETAEQRRLTPQTQLDKLRLVAEVARSVWG